MENLWDLKEKLNNQKQCELEPLGVKVSRTKD